MWWFINTTRYFELSTNFLVLLFNGLFIHHVSCTLVITEAFASASFAVVQRAKSLYHGGIFSFPDLHPSNNTQVASERFFRYIASAHHKFVFAHLVVDNGLGRGRFMFLGLGGDEGQRTP
jgi:hypothetical protein